MITKGSMRFIDPLTNEHIVFEVNSELYKSYCHIAQEIWEPTTRTWRKIPDRYPTHLNETVDYNVYLDGQIVPWWSQADSLRGYVDVIVGTDLKHRLFGLVKFEARVLHEVM